MNIFEEVKAAVDINTATEYYGLNVRKDTALCPFHNEKTGSLKLYHDHFYCFGCGEHGDVIKLTGKLLSGRLPSTICSSLSREASAPVVRYRSV